MTLRKSDTTRSTETTEMDESSPHYLIYFFGVVSPPFSSDQTFRGVPCPIVFHGAPLCARTQDKVSDQAPSGPELMDGVEDPNKPNPPVLETKVGHLDFIFGSKKFVSSFNRKMNLTPMSHVFFERTVYKQNNQGSSRYGEVYGDR